MNLIFDNNIPIYIQIVEKIKIDIISGKLISGERLPSVREFALQMKVNPNTIQRALSELEELGLIYTERTNGKFVTDNIKLIKKYKEEYAMKISREFFNSMNNIGLSKEEMLEYLGGIE